MLGEEDDIPTERPKEKLMAKNDSKSHSKKALAKERSQSNNQGKVKETPQREKSTTSESRDVKGSSKKGQMHPRSVKPTKPPSGTGDGGDNDAKDNLVMTLFEKSFLPVTCGTMTGNLQKNRFASGTTGKCIRTSSCWMTPEEFVQQGGDHRSRQWRREIRCHGMPLATLIEEKVLQLHSLLCECGLCQSEEQDDLDQNNDDHCFICGQDTELVCCDGCPRSFHHDCHLPPLGKNLGESWLCTFCIMERSRELCQRSLALEDALSHGIYANILQCQYLLLFLLKEDTELVFMQDPCLKSPNYASVIKRPMWLYKIIEKLPGQYSTVGQFVDDVQLIFKNCALFHKNNERGKMGVKLSDMFEKEFRRVFGIQ